MPYCFAEGDPGWDELGPDDPPHVTQFRYLPPPDVGGVPDPVRFSDVPPPDAPPSAATTAPAPTFFDRLFGRAPKPRSNVLTWKERQRQQQIRSAQWVAHLARALRDLGVARAYCRYDGGNDEGFAWLEHVEMKSGERLSPQEVAERLAGSDLFEKLQAANLIPADRALSEADELLMIMRDEFAIETSVMLLGMGYGTGPYWLYGAFTVDLESCTIMDDRQAQPVVENIQLNT